jgi:hypothetical protein
MKTEPFSVSTKFQIIENTTASSIISFEKREHACTDLQVWSIFRL